MAIIAVSRDVAWAGRGTLASRVTRQAASCSDGGQRAPGGAFLDSVVNGERASAARTIALVEPL